MRASLALTLGLSAVTVVPAIGQEPALVVENGRVIVGDGTVLERGSVVVARDRIVAVTQEPVEAPGARRIDASGKTVLPGLIDSHVHVAEEPGTAAFGRQYLAFGTTSIRDVGGPLDSLLAWRERWGSGEQPGPRLFMAGHPLDGDPPDWPYPGIAWPVTRVEEAELAVGLQRRLGVDLIKLYSALEPQVLKATIRAAHQHGLPATADLWRYTGRFDSVFAWGLDSFEHGFALCCGDRLPRPTWRSDRARVSSLVDALLEHDVTLVSTAVILDRQIRGGFPPDAPTYRALPPELQEASRKMWDQSQGSESWSAILADLAPGWPEEVCGPVRRFVNGGGKLALGTDSYLVVSYPGDVVAEAEFHAECGLAPATILAALTRNAAELLGREGDLGTLEAGKLADLIVVDGNPLRDLAALWNVEMVIKDGQIVVGGDQDAAGADKHFSCTQVLGFSQSMQWYQRLSGRPARQRLEPGAFLPTWQGRFYLGGAVEEWRDPEYPGWSGSDPRAYETAEHCSRDEVDRVVFNVSGATRSPRAWASTVDSVAEVIRTKFPNVRQIVMQPVVGAPNGECHEVRAARNHPVIVEGIRRSAARSGVKAGPSPEVATCTQFSDNLGHLVAEGAEFVHETLREHYRPSTAVPERGERETGSILR